MQIDPGSKEETYLILKYGPDYEAILVNRRFIDSNRQLGPLEEQVCRAYSERILKLFDSYQKQ